MLKKIITLLFIVYSLMFAVSPLTAMARIVPECNGPCGLCDFFLLIKNIFNFIAFQLAPPVAGLMFLLAGVLFLTAGGSEERVSQAKKIFVNVIIGLLFVYVSWLIVNTLINVIGKSIDGFNPETWWQFTCQ